MRVLPKLGFVILAAGMALAQTDGGGQNQNVADELKAMREAIATQQAQIAQQQQRIQNLEQQLVNKTAGTAHVADASLSTPAAPATAATTASNTTVVQETEKPKESPLSFRIGGTEFTPGGFVDFENVFRSTNTASNLATNFGAIPFSNTVAGHLTEFRSTGQYSRFNLKITGTYGANKLTGYIEGDFNGNDAANVFVTSNPHTNRLRLYWLNLRRGNWEFLAGQSWGMQTPNRTGLSPAPSDLAVTLNEDANINVGIPYTRAGLFRTVYHFSDHFQWGAEIQNPDQFVAAGAVIFPFAFNAQLGTQFDAANQTGAPNAFPDVHTKFAWDGDSGGKHYHWEAGGFLTSAKITVLPTVLGANFDHNTKIGGTFHSAFNFELAKGFRILANGMWGTGAGRYMIGLGPQAVVGLANASGAICTGGTGCTATVSMVHSGALTIGSEIQAGKKSQFGFYYGGNYFQRNAFLDITNPVPGRMAGFGGLNSPNSANRAIQEGTIDWTQTFWRNPQYGAVLLVTQGSYVTRSPWFVPPGAPKNAHLTMVFVSLRYALP